MTTPIPDTTSEATQAQRIAQVALAAVLSAFGCWTLWEFLPALVWAGILAIAVWPYYRRVRDRFPGGGRGILPPTCFTLAIALVFIVPVAIAGLQAAREAHLVLDWLDTVRREGIPTPAWLAHLPLVGSAATDWWMETVADPGAAAELLRHVNRADLFSTGRHVGAGLAHRAILFGFSLTALFFLLRDGEWVTAQMLRAGHRAFGPGGERIGRQIVASIHGTVDGLVLVGVGEGFILGVVYAFAGVPHPALLGALTAVAAMIPFGAPVLFGLAALLLVGKGAVIGAIVVLIAGIVVTFVADHFIRPVLIGGATQLPFIWVLLGILGGVATWGLIGLFIGPALMAALILLWREWAGEHDDV